MGEIEGKINVNAGPKAGFEGKSENRQMLTLGIESVRMALFQIKSDKFRTFLTLVGISVGIFSIVGVLTLIDSLHESLRSSFEEFGSGITFIEQMPFEPDLNEDGIFRWWEYTSRPQVSYEEYEFLRKNGNADTEMCYAIYSQATASNGKIRYKEGETVGVSGDWELMVKEEIVCGRKFNTKELEEGAAVCLIGWNAAERLGETGEVNELIGKEIRIGGRKTVVIGVFGSSGNNLMSLTDVDATRIVPVAWIEKIAVTKECRSTILVSADEGEIEQLRQLLRQKRRLKPSEKDNFSINKLTFVMEEMNGIFRIVNILGWIVGSFSLLVGGFGIANIMYVCVSERKKQIGIRKALGARKGVIAFQFLTESAILSIAGGIAGIVLIGISTLAIPTEMISIRLSLKNIAVGIILSVTIGILSGWLPAKAAADLNPVEAMNS